MATASTLLDDIRTQFGDTDKNFISDANGLLWLNEAQQKMSKVTYELKRQKYFPAYTYMNTLEIPDDCLMIEDVGSIRDLKNNLNYLPHREFNRRQLWVNNAVGNPRLWTQMDRLVYFWPRSNGSGLTTTVNASATETATSITMASTDNLRSQGRVKIDDEEIEYTNKGSITINGCLRGRGGTDTASHSSAASVMQLDFMLTYSRISTALTGQTSELEIREAWHDVLKNYVIYLAYLSEGDSDKAASYYSLWSDAMAQAEVNEKRRQDTNQNVIRDFESYGIAGDDAPGVY